MLHNILWALLLYPLVASAQIPADELLQRLEPRGYVNDYAGVLDAQERKRLESLLAEVERKTGAEIAVVALESLEGGQIEDFANRLFEKWGIGKKDQDNGVLLIAAIRDRKVRIEVGYGLEPVLPDARAGRILDQVVLPAFRAGHYARGLAEGAGTVARVLAEAAGATLEAGPPPGTVSPPQQEPRGCGRGLLQILILIMLIPVLIRHPWLLFFLLSRGRVGAGGSSGGGFGGGFGGFGGGLSGGGGASRGW